MPKHNHRSKSVRVKQHTPSERMHLRRKKRKEGPSGKRRAERRKAKQEAYAAMFKTVDAAFDEASAAINQPTQTGEAVPYAPFVHEVK